MLILERDDEVLAADVTRIVDGRDIGGAVKKSVRNIFLYQQLNSDLISLVN